MKVGLAKFDITPFIPGIGMMGYGQPHNIVKEVGTPLFARAFFLQGSNEEKLLIIHLELAFATLALKDAILKKLNPDWKISYSNLLLSAQHTHSAPGGYSHYPFYNFTIPGLRKDVVKIITNGAVSAAEKAYQNMEDAILSWGKMTIPEDDEVAFNRSMKAYFNNPEAKNIKADESHLAVNRTMEALFIHNKKEELKGLINWFGVHATSISSFNHRIHHDNKGVAAHLFEKKFPGSIAIFAQSAAGDVSPNFIWDKKLKRMRGKFTDQYENAEFNGELQFKNSLQIKGHEAVEGTFQSFHAFHNISSITAFPAHGVSFFQGTLEGPGIGKAAGFFLRKVSNLTEKFHLFQDKNKHQEFYHKHYPKKIVLDHRTGSFIGIPLNLWKKIPPLPDPTVEAFRKCAISDSLKTLPWVPVILPYQIIKLGKLLILAVPGEITTTAADRLKNYVYEKVKSLEISKVIIHSYSNAYMGYITTPEEYDLQRYEGGHTVYGRDTLKGIMNGFSIVVSDLIGETNLLQREDRPFSFPEKELELRSI